MTVITDPKPVNPSQLLEEITSTFPVLVAGGTSLVSVASEDPGVTVWLDDSQAALVPEIEDLIALHVPEPAPIRKVDRLEILADAVTTDATPVELYRLACAPRHIYQSTLTLIGVDRGNFATKMLEGRFGHQRLAGNALQVGAIVVLSDIHNPAAAAWAPNALPQGADVVFTVQGAAGRTIDWQMAGSIVVYAPEGLT